MFGAASHEATLYEREAELDQVGVFCERIRSGAAGILAVEGGAGVGKTSLLSHAGDRARADGIRVLGASASELERELPYGVMRQLFEPVWREADPDQRASWSEGAARLGAALLTDLPEGDAGPAAEPSFGALHGIYWLAVAIAEDTPTLLVVDDLQWADSSSLRGLAYLSRRLEGVPLGLIVALRTGERGNGQTIAGMLGTARGATVAPGPLSERGIGLAAEDRLGRALPEGCPEVCRELTGGNPLLLRELLDSIREEGIDLTPEAIGAVGHLAPSSLSRAVMLRLGRLSDEARRVARAVAVLGDAPELRHAAELAELSPEAALEAAASLGSTGIFAADQTLAFAHPLLRAGVYADLAAPERALLHGRAARILDDDSEPATLGPHLIASEPAGDGWAAETLLAAARAATAQGAASTAIACAERALREPPPEEVLAALLIELGTAELQQEEHERACAHLREALALSLRPEQRREAAVALGQALLVTEGTPAAVEALERQRGLLEGDDALRLALEQTMMAVFDPELATDALARMLEFAKLPGETPTERFALANACVPLGMHPQSRADDAVAAARRALADGALIGDPQTPDIAAGTALYPLVFAGELEVAECEADLVLAHAHATGSLHAFMVATCIRCDLLRHRGDLVAAAADGELLLETSDQLPDTPPVLRSEGVTVCWLAEIELLRGNADAAAMLVERRCEGRDLDAPDTALLHHARGLIALHRGDAEGAREAIERAGAVAETSGYEDRTTAWRLDAARARLALGDRGRAAELVDRQLKLARTWGAPGLTGIALRARALTEARPEAEQTLLEAIDLLDRAGFVCQLASARIDLGALLRRARRRAEGQELLQQGLDGAARCGALAEVERAREELRVLGAKPRRLAFSGVESLTAGERRVAELAARGMSNREIAQSLFVTLKTVEAHLSRTYRKLDIPSRDELPAALAGSGRGPEAERS